MALICVPHSRFFPPFVFLGIFVCAPRTRAGDDEDSDKYVLLKRPSGRFTADVRVKRSRLAVYIDGVRRVNEDVSYWNKYDTNYFKAGGSFWRLIPLSCYADADMVASFLSKRGRRQGGGAPVSATRDPSGPLTSHSRGQSGINLLYIYPSTSSPSMRLSPDWPWIHFLAGAAHPLFPLPLVPQSTSSMARRAQRSCSAS